MTQEAELPEELCTDEAVCFIADRHHVTPQQLLRHFLFEGTSAGIRAPEKAGIALEPNEIEILKGLSDAVGNLK